MPVNRIGTAKGNSGVVTLDISIDPPSRILQDGFDLK